MLSKERIGKITASECWKLMTVGHNKSSFGAPALQYIKEKRYERLLGRSINIEDSNKYMSWGSALEGYVYDNYIDVRFELSSSKTVTHDTGICCVTPDYTSKDTCGDIKCPFTLLSFCDQIEYIKTNDVKMFKANKPEYYWQLVCDSIVLKTEYCESAVFVPFESELKAVIDYFLEIEDIELSQRISWINYITSNNQLPHLIDGGKYNNINILRFKPSQEDKDLLILKINEANKLIGAE